MYTNPYMSLCGECAAIGWVSLEEYSNDAEVSEMWPSWIRDFYYTISDTAVNYTRLSTTHKYIFLPTAYCYIQWMNGIKFKDYRWVYMIPFIATIVPTGLYAIILDKIGAHRI